MKLYDAMIKSVSDVRSASISGVKVAFNRRDIDPIIYSDYTKKERYERIKNIYSTLKPIATFTSGLQGIEIIDIINGFDSYYALIREPWNNNKMSVHKIYDVCKGDYFKYGNMRIYLSDCIRCNF